MTPFTVLSLSIACLLMIASAIVQCQVTRNPTAERKQNRLRLYVWWVIFAVSVLVFQLGLIATRVFVFGLLCWAVIEIHSLFKKRIGLSAILAVCISTAAISIAIALFPHRGYVFFGLALISAVVVYLISIRSRLAMLGFCSYFGLSLFSILLLAELAHRQSIDFAYVLLVLFFVTAVNDIAQYISGSVFGRTKIAPIISPNKTVAGLFGGIVISSIVCGILLPSLIPISFFKAIATGSLIALAGFAGDLLISKLKRGLRVKHSGNSIAGHGGILDRIDSLMIIAPVFGFVLTLGGYL